MQNIEEVFERYFSSLEPDDPQHGAALLKLEESSDAGLRDLADAFRGVRDLINAKYADSGSSIIANTGPVYLHVNYVALAEVNAFAFAFEGHYFIAITEGMLSLFARSCSDLWRHNFLPGFLGTEGDRQSRDRVFQVLLLFELQYISNHELGHMFHGHCADLQKGRYRAEFSARRLADESIGMESQARELEADGYSINLMLQNLLQSSNGESIKNRLQSSLSARNLVLRLFVLSMAATVYYLEPLRSFNADDVEVGLHTEGLLRMNVLAREVHFWCDGNLSWHDALPVELFQQILLIVREAASNASQEAVWKQQDEFVQTEAGQAYLNAIYKRRENLRAKMTPHCWRLAQEQGVAADNNRA